MLNRAVVLTGIFLLTFGCSSDRGSESETGSPAEDTAKIGQINPHDLVRWRLLGRGEVGVDESENAVRFTEGAGSKGVTLVSPGTYGKNVIVSFKVKPLTYEGVNVIFLSASDKDSGGEIRIPEGHDDNFGFWSEGNVQCYMFAFHNGYHDSKPFIKKNPGMTDIAVADDLVMGERWHTVETGRRGSKLWIKIDGNAVAEGVDTDGESFPGGKVCFRLRGPGDGTFTSLYKDVVITEQK